jgi:hypothetical protein
MRLCIKVCLTDGTTIHTFFESPEAYYLFRGKFLITPTGRLRTGIARVTERWIADEPARNVAAIQPRVRPMRLEWTDD